jgi:DNA-binding LacI/PurR family transcriptional regulator
VPISDVLISRLYERKLPIVLIENHTEYGRCVTINQQKASYKAVAHFIAMGRKRIGCVIPPEESDPLWRSRVTGYRQALRDHGLPYDPTLISYVDWVGVKPGGLATRALLAQAKSVDAILYGSDTAAAGGMKMLRDLGRTVPDDVAVIGFDDEPFDIALQPSLSTIRQPIRKMAEAGLGLLFESMKKGDLSHREVEMETELIVRGSCQKDAREVSWR